MATKSEIIVGLNHLKTIANNFEIELNQEDIDYIDKCEHLEKNHKLSEIKSPELNKFSNRVWIYLIKSKCDLLLDIIKNYKTPEILLEFEFQLDTLKKDIKVGKRSISEYQKIIDGELKDLERWIDTKIKLDKKSERRNKRGLILTIIGTVLTIFGIILSIVGFSC